MQIEENAYITTTLCRCRIWPVHVMIDGTELNFCVFCAVNVLAKQLQGVPLDGEEEKLISLAKEVKLE